MRLTEEMIAEDEKRWHDRNIVAELGYCGRNIIHRNNITNDDIRFYAYIMRKAHDLLKEQEPKTGHWIFESQYCEAWSHTCSECGKRTTTAANTFANWCWNCGAKMTQGR